MKRISVILLILGAFILAENNLPNNSPEAVEIFKRIISKYDKSSSFDLTVDANKIKTIMKVDMLWLGTDSIIRKNRIQFIEPKDMEGVNLWLWNFKNKKNKMWVTKPGSGKKIDISNKKNNSAIDLSFIQLDNSILEDLNIVSDTVSYNEKQCYIVSSYKLRKNKKLDSLMKFWINSDNFNIQKIEKYDKRRKMISEIIFERYSNDFPQKISIKNLKQKNKSIIYIDNYNQVKYDDNSIFEPRDIKND